MTNKLVFAPIPEWPPSICSRPGHKVTELPLSCICKPQNLVYSLDLPQTHCQNKSPNSECVLAIKSVEVQLPCYILRIEVHMSKIVKEAQGSISHILTMLMASLFLKTQHTDTTYFILYFLNTYLYF